MAVEALRFAIGAVDNTKRGFASARRGVTGLERSATRARRVLGGVLAATGVTVGINQIRQLSDEYITLSNRVRLFTRSSSEAASVQNELFELSNRTRSSVSTTAQIYQRLAQANQTLNLSQSAILTVVENIGKAVRVSGVDAASANQALIQLGQGIASGQLRGQELNSVLEQTPRVAQQIADTLGVGIGQIRALAIEGKVTSEVIIEAFTNVGKLDEEFSRLGITFGEAFTVIGNESLRAVGNIQAFAGGASQAAESVRDIGVSVVRFLGRAAINIFIELQVQTAGWARALDQSITGLRTIASILPSIGGGGNALESIGAFFRDLPASIEFAANVLGIRFGQAITQLRLQFEQLAAVAEFTFDVISNPTGVVGSYREIRAEAERIATAQRDANNLAIESIDSAAQQLDFAKQANAEERLRLQNVRDRTSLERANSNASILDAAAGGQGANLAAPVVNETETRRALTAAAKFVKENYEELLTAEFSSLTLPQQDLLGARLREDTQKIADSLRGETQVRSDELSRQLSILDAARTAELGIEQQSLEARRTLIENFVQEISGISQLQQSTDANTPSIFSLVPGASGDIAARAQEELAELQAAFEERRSFLEDINSTELDVQIARDDSLLQEELRLQEGIRAIQERAKAAQAKSESDKFRKRLSQSTNFFNNLVTATRGNNETLVKLAKAAGIAEAVINTAVGVTHALRRQDYAGAAIVAAQGAAQIATIASQNAGSSDSSISAPGGGGSSSTDTGSDNEVDLINPTGARTNVNITLEGRSYSSDELRELIELLNEEIGDGAELNAVVT